MKHYHGTPIGGRATSTFLDGRFALIPWKRPDDLERAKLCCRGFIADNSAFSFWSSGESPEWSGYLKWCQGFAHHPRFDFALVPDAIDGTEQDNRDLLAWWQKKAYVPVRIPSCPVWHLHESLDRLRHLCRTWERVALGSSGDWPTPGVGDWWDRMADAFDVICDDDGFPCAKIHGLRMLAKHIVEAFPFASADSTNAAQNGSREALKNQVDAEWGSSTIARRIELVQSPCRWDRKSFGRQLQLFA